MAKKLSNLTGSGDTSWPAPRVRSERAALGGLVRDFKTNQQVGSGGKKSGNVGYKVRRTSKGNVGSFKK